MSIYFSPKEMAKMIDHKYKDEHSGPSESFVAELLRRYEINKRLNHAEGKTFTSMWKRISGKVDEIRYVKMDFHLLGEKFESWRREDGQ